MLLSGGAILLALNLAWAADDAAASVRPALPPAFTARRSFGRRPQRVSTRSVGDIAAAIHAAAAATEVASGVTTTAGGASSGASAADPAAAAVAAARAAAKAQQRAKQAEHASHFHQRVFGGGDANSSSRAAAGIGMGHRGREVCCFPEYG